MFGEKNQMTEDGEKFLFCLEGGCPKFFFGLRTPVMFEIIFRLDDAVNRSLKTFPVFFVPKFRKRLCKTIVRVRCKNASTILNECLPVAGRNTTAPDPQIDDACLAIEWTDNCERDRSQEG